jgi:putative membrane protein
MQRHRAIQILTALVLTCIGATGCNDDAPPPTTNDNEPSVPETTDTASLPDADRQILQTVHEKNLEEIAVGRMAKEKGTTEGVRAYGEQLVNDHTQNESDLTALTGALGISLSEPAKKSAAESALEPLRGVEFDARFAELMNEGHSSLVQKIEAAESQVRNEQVRSFLAKTLPVLRRHLQMAQEQAGPGGHGNASGAHKPQDPPSGG